VAGDAVLGDRAGEGGRVHPAARSGPVHHPAGGRGPGGVEQGPGGDRGVGRVQGGDHLHQLQRLRAAGGQHSFITNYQ
jgi:hypothetical protein